MNRISKPLLDCLRGGLHPRDVAMAVSLGLLAGFVTGSNLCFAATLVAALSLNVSWRVFAQGWLAGFALSIVAAPLTAGVGRWLFTRGGLGRALTGVHEHPLFVLSDLDRYTTAGGVVCGLLIAVPVAALAAKLAANVQGRGKALALVSTSPAASMLRFHLRAANWLLCGGALQPVPAGNARLMRRGGMLLLVCCFGPLAGGAYFMSPKWSQSAVLHALSAANGAQVDAASVKLSLTTGKLEIHDLQVADPEHLDRDRLRVNYLAAQLKPGLLWRGQVHVERLLLEEVNGDTARQTRADAFGLELPDFDRLAADVEPQPTVESDGARPLQDCLSDWPGVQMRLARVQQLLTAIEELSRCEPASEELARNGKRASKSPDFAELRDLRHQFGPMRPKVLVELAAAKGLSHRFGLGQQAVIEIANLSSRPNLTGKPTRVAVIAPEPGIEMAAMLNLHRPGDQHELRFKAAGIYLPRVIDPSFARSELTCDHGKINVTGKGWGDSSQFEMQLRLDARELRARVPGDGASFGLKAETWNEGLSRLDNLEAQAVLFGAWSSPRVRLDGQHLVTEFRRLFAGDAAFVARIDEQLGKPAAAPPPQILATAPAASSVQAPPSFADSPRLPVATKMASEAPTAAPVFETARPEEKPRYMSVEHRRRGETASSGASSAVLPSPAVAASEMRQPLPVAASAMLPDTKYVPSAAVGVVDDEPKPAIAAAKPVVECRAPKLQYPESLRTVSAEGPVETVAATNEPAAVEATETASVEAGVTEPQFAASSKPSNIAVPAVDKLAAEPPPKVESENPGASAAIRDMPAPAGLELGYDARKPKYKDTTKDAAAPVTAPPVAAATPADVPIERLPGSEPARQSLPSSLASPARSTNAAMSESLPVTTAPKGAEKSKSKSAEVEVVPADPDAPSQSRIGNWSKTFVKKLKGIAPRALSKSPPPPAEEAAAVVASDEPPAKPAAPPGGANVRASATEPAPAVESPEPAATPWLKRFWR